jgi:hypothetical protein
MLLGFTDGVLRLRSRGSGQQGHRYRFPPKRPRAPLQVRRKMPPQTTVDIISKFGEVWTMTIFGPV